MTSVNYCIVQLRGTDVWLGTIEKETQCGKFSKLKENTNLKEVVQSETKTLVSLVRCYIQNERRPIGSGDKGDFVGYIIVDENSVVKEIKDKNIACNVNLLQMEEEAIKKWNCLRCHTERHMIKENLMWKKSCAICLKTISTYEAANSKWLNEQEDEDGKQVFLIRAAHLRCVAVKWRIPAMREDTCLNCGWWQGPGLDGN
ncbi:CLUMA_CG016601, isoform A [Clunio marinus]|uniref:CLUMA_CG016601, isoform A n=1 Tax=Clunio marinus TaxID=568069 RepID=A0A1J1IVQ3_9DIPT|nr:CLUMA_CG016601, isoform A [Clunio marinus]